MGIPLTVFEYYMLADDRPAYPMNIFIRFRFRGQIDADLFRQSVARATARHQLFSSKVIRLSRRKSVWEWCDVPVDIRTVSFDDTDRFNESGYICAEPLDLYRAPGFRVYLIESPDNNETASRTDVVFQIHHSIADGVGIFAFLSDLWVFYNAGKDGVCDESLLTPVDPEVFARRGKYKYSIFQLYGNAWYNVRSSTRFLFRKIMSMVPFVPPGNDELPPMFPMIRTCVMSKEETAAYLKKAKVEQVTLNDLALRDSFLAIADWKKRHGTADMPGKLRVAVPMDLRDEGHRNLAAANVVTMAFVDTAIETCDDPALLLRNVHDEMELIKKRGQRYILGIMLKRGKLLTGDLSWYLKAQKCRATFCLSNLGQMFAKTSLEKTEEGLVKMGALTLESLDAIPPIRPGTMVSCFLGTYAGRIGLTLRCDERFLSVSDADELLKLLCARMNAEAVKSNG